MRDPSIGDELDGYQLTELVARSGMATIFRAVDRQSGEVVAVKLPHLQYEADVVFYQRFRREEEAARRLDHPNLVKALPPRGEKSRLYMVLEYVDGTPLSALLEEGRPLPAARALDIARQTCDALAYLHGQGILHRDVKPGNILLTPAGRVKLLDLGIAHVTGARRLTIAGLTASFGTPDYMAPEQARGRVGDGRVDVYALGTTLYQMLTGRLPFAGVDWEKLVRAKQLEDPTPPSVHVPDLAPELEAIVMKAIARAPADRYPTAADMLAELRDPGMARVRAGARPGAPPRRRRDLRPLAAAVAVLLALGGVGWIAWLGATRPPARVVAARGAGAAAAPSASAQRGGQP